MLAAILAVVSIVFPPEGAKFPALSRCYVMGAADSGETELVVSSLTSCVSGPVSVSRTGAWATVVDVKPGTNVVEVGGVKRSFVVAATDGTSQTSGTSRAYKKLEYAGDAAKPHPAGRKPGEITVTIDAGHGGSDSGALSPHGLPEKDANLRLAWAVRDELRRRGYKVVMTRETDVFVGLYDRPKVAHGAKADLFVSIHHNAPGYAMDPLAVRSQSVYAWNQLGEKLAKAINARMAAADPQLKNDGVLHANFAVTRNPEIPSCLIEADYVTHPDGELAAWDAMRRQVTAAAIADGIADWVAGEAATDRRENVRTLAEAHVAEGKILGAVVAAKDFAPLAVGNRVVDPSPIAMDVGTRFDCASVTKTVVAMTCARLAAQGRIDVDRPFTDYLADHVLAKEGCAITVRDLAMHVGGFRGDIRYQQQKDYGEFRRVAMELRPTAPRGSYEYECINMIYVGWIVEKVTGTDLATAAKKLVLEPLGMTQSGWGPLAADANVAFIPVALMHLDAPVWKKHYNAGLGWPSDPGANFAAPHPIGNAGLFSTAGDLLLFVRDLAERRHFEPRAYDLVLTCGYEKDGVRRSFGFDMTTSKMPSGVSRQAISHTGWSGQTIVADPGTGFYGVVLTARKSMEHGKCRQAREKLLSLICN